jgi:hypothetical protein
MRTVEQTYNVAHSGEREKCLGSQLALRAFRMFAKRKRDQSSIGPNQGENLELEDKDNL